MHDYNEELVIKKIKDYLENQKISLISDAGSPLISDPGYKLVKYCVEHKYFVSIIPGASSLTSALQISSIPINSYTFHGFSPKTKYGVSNFIQVLRDCSTTSVFFVSSHKIYLLIEAISSEMPERKLAVCKELTKINEKVFVGPSKNVFEEFKKSRKNSLGEFVLVLEGKKIEKKSKNKLSTDTIKIMKKLLNKFSLTDTVAIVHKIGNLAKKEVYKKALELQNEK